MKEYLRWSLRLLYLTFLCPTQFSREVEGEGPYLPKLSRNERFSYMLRMLPWIFTLTVITTLVAGYPFDKARVFFPLPQMVIWVSLIMACGMQVGVTRGVLRGLAFSVAFGVMGGVTFATNVVVEYGMLGGMASGLNRGTTRDVGGWTGILVSAVCGLVFSVAGDMVGSVAFAMTFALLGGLLGGLVFGAASGAAFGIAVTLIFWLSYFRLITYPFHVAMAITTYTLGRWRPSETGLAWRWCPVTWNEMIWLPLPYVGKFLALLVREHRTEGFKQIAFVAAERKPQRRAALTALVEVAINDLQANSLMGLSNVMERLSWTMDSPAELSDDLTATLPRFERAAQHVGQYLTLNSTYRKKEALARGIGETEAVQRSLIAARGRYAPRLLQVANEWRSLLEEESEKVAALAEGVREIPNPFVFGNPVMETEHNVFTGRRDVVRQIEASELGVMQTPTLLLHGPRRMGKTSILNQLPRLLGSDFAATVIDCQNPAVTDSAATLLRYVSRGLSRGLRPRRVAVEPLTAEELMREPFVVFDDWLDGLERAMPERMRALLCLDEYERLQATLDAGWGGSFLDALRHTLQHRPRVVLMFAGAHTFQELGPAWTDRFISARRVRISFLTREEVLPLLTQPVPEFDMTYAPGALDAITMATNCQPFLTQAVAFELVQLLNEQQRKEAATADVEVAIARALESGGEYFANVWSDAGPEGQLILRAIVQGDSPPDFPNARAWLREHDVLTGDGQFAVEMVRRWVKVKSS